MQTRFEDFLDLLADGGERRKCDAEETGVHCGKGPFILEIGVNGTLDLSGKRYAYSFKDVFMYKCLPATDGLIFAYNRQTLYRNGSLYHLFEDPNKRFPVACMDGDLAGFSCEILMKSLDSLHANFQPFEIDNLRFMIEQDKIVYLQTDTILKW